MRAPSLVLPLLSLSVTLIACGPPGAAQDDSGAAESGSDTGAAAAECAPTQLDVGDPSMGFGVDAVLLPAAKGGVNHGEGSCGGAGVDAAYVVKPPHTTGYRLSVASSAPLTLHVHAGDCDGPELACETGSAVELDLMLSEGEPVVLVVDSDPDLAIPDEGLAYTVSANWGPDPDPPCDFDAVQSCAATVPDELAACMTGVACGDFDAAATCHSELAADYAACTEQFCPDEPWKTDPNCLDACAARRQSCEADCDAHNCEYERLLCAESCTYCNTANFTFEFTGACELSLPGPPVYTGAVWIEISGQRWWVFEQGVACEDPREPGVVWTSESSLQLCDPTCAAFEAAGAATVVYGIPPCE